MRLSGPDRISKVILISGPGGDPLWGGNLGFDRNDAAKTLGVHVSFLRKVAGMKARKMGVDTWLNEGAERVIQETGTKPLREYIKRRQVTVI